MTEAQIKHMVDRFLQWRLPKPWHPDNGISYVRPNYAHAPADHDWPTGTNLFDAGQADAMVRHMIDGIPDTDALISPTQSPPATEGSGWTPWGGKGKPELNGSTLVQAKMRNGLISKPRAVDDLWWQHNREGDEEPELDVVAYRIVSAPKTDWREVRVAELTCGELADCFNTGIWSIQKIAVAIEKAARAKAEEG